MSNRKSFSGSKRPRLDPEEFRTTRATAKAQGQRQKDIICPWTRAGCSSTAAPETRCWGCRQWIMMGLVPRQLGYCFLCLTPMETEVPPKDWLDRTDHTSCWKIHVKNKHPGNRASEQDHLSIEYELAWKRMDTSGYIAHTQEQDRVKKEKADQQEREHAEQQRMREERERKLKEDQEKEANDKLERLMQLDMNLIKGFIEKYNESAEKDPHLFDSELRRVIATIRRDAIENASYDLINAVKQRR